MPLLRALLVCLVAASAACTHTPSPTHPQGEGQAHGTGHHRFDDAEAWAARFEDPRRDSWQLPDQVIAALKLEPQMSIADIGAATGYFPVRFARAVPQGMVYGIDVESSMVEYLGKRAEKEGIANLKAVLAAFDDAKVPEPVDVITLVNTYHHIDARPAYFTRLAQSLKPGGRLVIIDFTRASKMGPPASEKVPAEDVEAELAQAGYVRLAAHAFLPEQFFIVFGRK